MKRLFITLLIFVLVTGVITSCNNGGDQKEDSSKEVNDGEVEIKPLDLPIEEIALLFIQDLIDGNYEDAYNKYVHDETMKSAVNPQKYKLIFEDIFNKYGEFIEIKDVFQFKMAKFNVISIPVIFKEKNTNINIYFNDEKYISMLLLGEYQEIVKVDMPDTIKEEEIVANVNGYELGGTLTLPKVGNNFPCLVIVHGSGANDRDLTVMQNKVYRDISWGLAEQGIAVYRYDKRNYVYGEEFSKVIDATLYDETIDDAVEIVKMLQTNELLNKNEIYVLGHSIGGYAMPRIAENSSEAAGFIIMAGNVRSLTELIPIQYEYISKSDGEVTSQEQMQINMVNNELAKLDNIDDLSDNSMIMGIYKAYWLDLLNYNPIEVASTINKPVLVLQGERDYQVTMEDFNMWKDTYGTKANWSFITYPKLNHLMMPGEGPSTPEEYQIPNRVEQKLIDDVVNWIKSN